MKKFMMAMIIVLVVTALALCGFMVLGIMGYLPRVSFFDFDARLKLGNRQEFSASEIENLNINYRMDSIELIPSGGDTIVLEEYFTRWDDTYAATTYKSGSQLDITAGQRPIMIGISFWHSKIKVYLPAKYMGNVSITNSSGSIRSEHAFDFNSFEAKSTSGSVRMGSIHSKNNITLTSSSGGVSAEKLSAEGDIKLKSTSGSVRPGLVQGKTITASSSSGTVAFEGAEAGTITASSGSGSVRFTRISGSFSLKSTSGGVKVEGGKGSGTATSSSGSVKLTLEEVTGDLSLTSTSGSCRLYLPQGNSFTFHGNTSSGSIKVPDENALSFNKRGNEATGTIGSSPTFNLIMKTSSGSISVEWV